MRLKKSLLILLIFFLAAPAISVFAQLPPKIEGMPPIPENAQFNIDLADIYAELFPAKNTAEIICNLWLTCNGSDPVLLKMEGELHHMKVSSPSKQNLTWVYIRPYLHLDNLPGGSHQIIFEYLVKHNGISSPGLIATNDLRLGADTFWYPRNVASDSHQVILNLVTSPEYPVTSNAPVYKDVPNNLKRLRQMVLATPLAEGLLLD